MKNSKVVELGDLVKDSVTQLNGVATSLTRFLNGMDQVGIQPQMKKSDSKLPEAWCVDITNVSVVKKSQVKVSKVTDQAYVTVELGDQAKDPVTGFEGIVTEKTVFLNGCTQIGLTPKIDKTTGNRRDKEAFPAARVKLIKRGVHTSQQLKEADKPTQKSVPGGPMRRSQGWSG